MSLRDIFEKLKQRRERLSNMQEQDKLETTVRERKKNANERELEKYYEQERQKNIKRELENFHKRDQKEFWHKDVISQKYMFKHKNLFAGNGNICMPRRKKVK